MHGVRQAAGSAGGVFITCARPLTEYELNPDGGKIAKKPTATTSGRIKRKARGIEIKVKILNFCDYYLSNRYNKYSTYVALLKSVKTPIAS